MALAVDRFSLLENELFRAFSSGRDALALVGTLWLGYRAVSFASSSWSAFKVYGISGLMRPADLVNKYGKWAAVTGSTHGIGKAFAQELASHGHNIMILSLGDEDCSKMSELLVVTGCTAGLGQEFCRNLASAGMNILLVSRNADLMRDLAAQLERTFGVETMSIPIDFNEGPPAFERLRRHLQSKEIGILVNNVGVMYDYPQLFLDVPYERLWELVHVNVAAATMMTHMVLPQMVARGKGAVITVSSGASFLPTPQMTVYSATKQYLNFFMKALSYEYRNSGVTFQCLQPFYVATRMTQYSSTLSNASLTIPSASTYVRHALLTLGWSSCTPGYWPHSVLLWLAGLIPEWLWLWSATRLNNALRRQARERLRHCSGSTTRQL